MNIIKFAAKGIFSFVAIIFMVVFAAVMLLVGFVNFIDFAF